MIRELANQTWKTTLKDAEEIAEYFAQWGDVKRDPLKVKDDFKNASAELKELPVKSLKFGVQFFTDRLRNKSRENNYKKMAMTQIPPLVVENNVVIDGNRRFLKAHKLGLETVRAYVIKRSAPKLPPPPVEREIRLPELKAGMRYEPYQFQRWCAKDDLKGIKELYRYQPGDVLIFTYQVLGLGTRSDSVYESFSFGNWIKMNSSPKTGAYLVDEYHKKKIEDIKRKILNYKQLYLSFVDEKYNILEGHHRLIAASVLGAKKFPVMVVRHVPVSKA
jgi:hypothetical protein